MRFVLTQLHIWVTWKTSLPGNQTLSSTNDFRHLSLVITDLDNFKEVNDTWGHHAGDNVLQRFAEVLEENTRDADLVSRWGGEEFLIICPETDSKGAFTRAEKLRASFSKIIFENVGRRTASFGVSSYFPGESKNNLVQRADLALYRAKDGGRDRVEKEL